MSRETKLILGLADPDAPRPDKAAAAELAARVLDGAMALDAAGNTTAEMAARLDGGLDGQAQDRFDRALAADGPGYQELAASAHLVDAVTARLVAAPADLVKPTAATPHTRPARHWSRWLWTGGAVLATVVAAAVLATVVAAALLLHRPPPPSTGTGPTLAAPAQDAPPKMMPAGSLESTPAPGPR